MKVQAQFRDLVWWNGREIMCGQWRGVGRMICALLLLFYEREITEIRHIGDRAEVIEEPRKVCAILAEDR